VPAKYPVRIGVNLGQVVEYGPTARLFTNPILKETEDYITGRFG